MEKIYMEKESVARLVLNAVILLVSLFSLVVICIEHHWGIPFCSAILFVLLSALGIWWNSTSASFMMIRILQCEVLGVRKK